MSQRPSKYVLFLTCEHAGNHVPKRWQRWFATPGAQQQLRSHRGYDPGALMIARQLAGALDIDLHYSEVSRLLIELNRSLDSASLFSPFTQNLSDLQRQRLIEMYYMPFRQKVHRCIAEYISQRTVVLHFSVHTFTPLFRGQRRPFDIGVLFDPSRRLEQRLSQQLVSQLGSCGYRTHANRPYLGTDVGHTTQLRQQFSSHQYVGIELELNNRIANLSEKTQRQWSQDIADSITKLRR